MSDRLKDRDIETMTYSHWDDIIGNRWLKTHFRAMAQSVIGPSQGRGINTLVLGESRTGKTSTAEFFFKVILCRNIDVGSLRPCGHCQPCDQHAARYGQIEVEWIIDGGGTTDVAFVPIRAVYQRLPSEMKFEYAGYLTKAQIVYWKGDSHSARSLTSKACTFHSHPTRLGPGEPDLPSAADIRFFLIGRNRRTITVGRFKIWVWDKTPPTLVAARSLFNWESKNLLKTCNRLQAQGKSHWEERFFRKGLQQVGVTHPNKSKIWDRIWVNEVQTKLGFRVTLFDRDDA